MTRSFAAALLALAALAPSLTPSLARADPRGEELVALMKANSGGAILDTLDGFHESGEITRDGIAGTFEMWADVRTGRTHGTSTIAGRTLSGGYDGKASWGVDAQGMVHTDTSPEALEQARMGAYLTVGGYYWPDRFPASFTYKGRRKAPNGFTYDVVTVVVKDALTADMWLDVPTHHLRRVTANSNGVDLQGEVREYRMFDGAWVGVKLDQIEGEHHMTRLTTFFHHEKPSEDQLKPSGR
jgi:hypothetical protein